MPTDIRQYNPIAASDKPRGLELRNPFTGDVIIGDDGEPVTFRVYGMLSSHAKRAVAEHVRLADRTEEQKRQDGAELLAAITAWWSSNFCFGKEGIDERFECTRENAVRLYLDQDWIGGQVLAFARELRNYSPER